MEDHLADLIPIAIAFILGGILKGATGAGAPIMAVPLLAIIYDVPFAVAVFVIPSVASNIWQVWIYRAEHLSRRFVLSFSAAGALGAVLGSVMLASLPSQWLMLLIAIGVFAYVASRLLWQGWQLSMSAANRLVLPAGFAGGVLQGATGVSAPVTISFLNAMRLDRLQFVATISTFFLAVSTVQFIALSGFGIMTASVLMLGALAILPLVLGMALGSAMVRYVSKQTFDKLILGLLVVLAVKLVVDAI